jgi:cytochrome c peroxidase
VVGAILLGACAQGVASHPSQALNWRKTMKRIDLRAALLCGTALLLAALTGATAQAQSLSGVEQLGKSIFFDDNLSLERNQACAACHGPEVGFTGPISDINAHGAVYEGSVLLRFGDRKPPSAAYATVSPIFYQDKTGLFIGGNFWDGRATGEVLGNPAADQALGPFLNPVEQALSDKACVVYRVCNPAVPGDYPVSFADEWPGGCDITWPVDTDSICAIEGMMVPLSGDDRDKVNESYGNVGLSIAAFEDSPEVNAFTSKHDLTFRGMAKLSKEERRGKALFQGKGRCKLCHPGNGQQAESCRRCPRIRRPGSGRLPRERRLPGRRGSGRVGQAQGPDPTQRGQGFL